MNGSSGGAAGEGSAENPYVPCPMDEPFDNACPTEGSRCSDTRGCEPPCATTACPVPQTGTVAPLCEFGYCILDCSSGETCPDGKLCINGLCAYEEP